MAKIQIAMLVGILSFLFHCATTARADDDPEPDRAMPEQFSDRLAIVIRSVADHYYYEIDNGELLRWAVKGLDERRDKAISERLAARLGQARALEMKELRGLLTEVANDCGGDLRAHADSAVKRMLARLDGRTQVIELGDGPIGFAPSSGIGVKLAVDPATGMIRVQYPFFNGPAYRTGLRSGDLIAEIIRPKREVPNEPPPGVEVIPTKGLTPTSALEHMAGDRGRSLYLNVRRPAIDKVLQFTVLCAKDEPETVFGVRRGTDDRWDHWLDPNRKLGYVRLAAFRDQTHKVMANELAALRMQGMKALVLDLRGNTGGSIFVLNRVAEMFVGEAPLYTLSVRDQGDELFEGHPVKTHRDFPMVCLVDGATVRTAEVLAACLQDNQRAVIIGARTQGYASVEHFSVHGDTFMMRVTTGIFFRPRGQKLDRISPPGKPSDEWGVTPDKGYELNLPAAERAQLRAHFEGQLVIPPPGRVAKEQAPAFKDRQLEAAIECLLRQPRSGGGR